MRRHIRLVVMTAFILVLAGCGTANRGPSVATANGGAAPVAQTSSTPVDRGEALRSFAQCMRDNGVDVPDPQPGAGGGIRIGGGAGAIDPTSERFRTAFEKCRTLLPNGGEPPQLSPEELEQQRKFAACMREHGIDFPDPDPQTGRVLVPNQGTGMDRNSQQFRDALEACRDLRPRRLDGGR